MKTWYEYLKALRTTHDVAEQVKLINRMEIWMKAREREFFARYELYTWNYTTWDYMKDYANYEAYCIQTETDIGFDQWLNS